MVGRSLCHRQDRGLGWIKGKIGCVSYYLLDRMVMMLNMMLMRMSKMWWCWWWHVVHDRYYYLNLRECCSLWKWMVIGVVALSF